MPDRIETVMQGSKAVKGSAGAAAPQVLGAPGAVDDRPPTELGAPGREGDIDPASASTIDNIFSEGGEGDQGTPAPAPAAPTESVPSIEEIEGVSPAAAPAPASEDEKFDAETTRLAKEVPDTPAAQNTFQRLRAELKAALADNRTLRSAKPPVQGDAQETEALRKQVAELEDRIGRIDLEQSVGFRREFVEPAQKARASAIRLLVRWAGKNDKEAAEAADALFAAEPSAQQDMILSLPPNIQQQMTNFVDVYEEVQSGRKAALESWRSKMAAMQEHERRSSQLTASKELSGAVDGAITALQSAKNAFFTPSADGKNAQDVEQRIQTLRGVMEAADVNQVARLVAEGIAYAGLTEQYGKLRRAYVALREWAARVQGARPPFTATGDPGAASPAAPRKISTPDDVEREIWKE